MKIENLKKLYKDNKFIIYLVAGVLAIILLSWYGTTYRYSYKSYEECLLIKMQNNEKLYFVAQMVCDKEVEVEFEKIKKDWDHLFDFKRAIDDGYTKKEIIEELSKNQIEFLTIRSVNLGIRKLISNDEDRMIGVLKGGVIGSIIGYLIGLIIEISMFLIKRFKNEK